MNLHTLSKQATLREFSVFQDDLQQCQKELLAQLKGSRVLVIGGAGTIGSSTIHQLVSYDVQALHVVDVSENNLTELVRDLRASNASIKVQDFRVLPLDYGQPFFYRFLHEQADYDFILNFSALKHVRSEKDVYSLLQLLDTNVVKLGRLFEFLAQYSQKVQSVFSVSTDKAANPVNFMGASKRFMEHVLFNFCDSTKIRSVSSRFANVAFSDGSLLFSWIHRIAKGQPIPVPEKTWRFFISIEEAGQICLLAAILGESRQIQIPNFSSDEQIELVSIARQFIHAQGFEPREYREENEAKCRLADDVKEGYYPLLITPLDTSGEKEKEEFLGEGEVSHAGRFSMLKGIEYFSHSTGKQEIYDVYQELSKQIHDPKSCFTKENCFLLLKKIIPEFTHNETGKNLDSRL